MSRPANLANLSAAEIEQRLQQPGLADEEQVALVEALSNRVAEELLADRGGSSPKEPAAGAHSFKPPPVTVPSPQARPAAPAAAQQPNRLAGGAWVVITLVNRSNLSGGGGGAGSGPAGRVRVDWALEGVPYVATLETGGSSGVAEVTFVNPQTGDQVTVEEDLELEGAGGALHYTGSNPRDAGTGASLSEAEYSPDVFYLQRTSGGWRFTKICDLESSRCAQAAMTVL
jgi:hypothetical protein